MLDTASQARFTRGCVESAAGYATAATAAYTNLAAQALDFWCMALSGLGDTGEHDCGDAPAASSTGSAKAAAAKDNPATPDSEPAFGLALSDWCAFPWLDPRRYEALFELDASTPPVLAMFAFANTMPLRGSSKSWPFAKVMIDSGVPRAVAWPAAEANAAALDAADEASRGFHQVLASYHTEGGFANTLRSITPSLAAIAATTSISLNPFLLHLG
jgi:hypothetical protein